VLLKPPMTGGEGMEEVSRTKVDANGKFTIMVPEDGMPTHAIRINHQKVDFLEEVSAGKTSVQITVYDAAPIVDGIKIAQSEVYQAEGNTLHGVEFFVIENKSIPKVTQPNFQFYLPDGATMEDGQATYGKHRSVRRPPVPLDEKNKYEMHYPLRPGTTRFEVRFSIPYGGTIKINSKVANNVEE